MKARRIALIILMVLAAAHGAHSLPISVIELRGGPTWIGNAYREYPDGTSVQGSDVSPLRMSGGVAVPLETALPFIITPGLDFYWQEYLAVEDGKVVPTQKETGTAAGDLSGTLGIVLTAPASWEWQLRDRLRLGAGAGPAILLRLPVGPIDGSSTEPLWQYFYSSLRFFYPETHLSLRYGLSERLEFGGILRVLWPIASLWSEYDVPFWDEMMISLMAAFRFHTSR